LHTLKQAKSEKLKAGKKLLRKKVSNIDTSKKPQTKTMLPTMRTPTLNMMKTLAEELL
jgi:hypothetical protein